MNLFLPKQHGAWAMLIIPFWLGVSATSFQWQHVPFFAGWVLLYLATYPMLLLFKRKQIQFYIKWTIYYLVPASLLLIIPLYDQPKLIYFGLAMVPCLGINAYFSSRNQDRAFANDLVAIFAFSIAGVGSGYFVTEQINHNLLMVFVSSVMFFLGSTFYVKSMIRERKNNHFKWLSWGYHLLTVILWIALGEWLIVAAFVPSLVRAVAFYGKPLSAKKVGIYEIVNAVIMFGFIFIRLT